MGVPRFEVMRWPGPHAFGAPGVVLSRLWTLLTVVPFLAITAVRTHGVAAGGEQGRAEFEIPPDPGVLRDLRIRTRDVLREWGMPEVVVDAAVLASHELAINALLHTKAAATLRLILLDGRLRVEVSDPSAAEPNPCAAKPGELEHGLGLTIVANLADAWGHGPSRSGKTVWCELLA